MKFIDKTKMLVSAALLAAFTCISTMIIQIPTPTLGYIHIGDTFVILCGIILGPIYGAITAGVGSMLADILSGYMIYAVPTLIIKAISASLAGMLFCSLHLRADGKHVFRAYPSMLIASLLCEANVIIGYFINSIIKTMFLNASFSQTTLSIGVVDALSGIVPNMIQGFVGILLASALFPLLMRIPDIRNLISSRIKK